MFYGHGDEVVNERLKANFSSNVWHGKMPLSLKRHLKNSIHLIDNYPPPQDGNLIKKIANFHKTQAKNIFLSSGSTPAIYLLAQVFQKSSALILEPTFREYHDACHSYKIKIKKHKWFSFSKKKLNGWKKNLKKKIKKNNFKLVFLCNPNNPDGSYLPFEEVLYFVKKFPNTYFIIDEAYFDFCYFQEKRSLADFVHVYKNIIVLKSLTKNFSMPGLRLAYLLTNEYVIQRLQQKSFPWAIHSLALQAGHWIFDNGHPLPFQLKTLQKNTQKFISQLKQEISSMEILSTNTHYFLIKLVSPSSKKLKKHLLEKEKILIRDASNFYFLNEHFIRLSLQRSKKNKLLLQALKKYIEFYQI